MRNISLILVVLIFLATVFPAVGQTNGDKISASGIYPKETFFIKTGGGVLLGRIIFIHYPYFLNGQRPNLTENFAGLSGYITPLSFGIDFPDRFSFFVSDESLLGLTILVNAQYTISKFDNAMPYIYFGSGLDVDGAAIGPAFQLGIGSNFVITEGFDLFLETKLLALINFYSNDVYRNEDYTSWEFRVPVEAGLNFNL